MGCIFWGLRARVSGPGYGAMRLCAYRSEVRRYYFRWGHRRGCINRIHDHSSAQGRGEEESFHRGFGFENGD